MLLNFMRILVLLSLSNLVFAVDCRDPQTQIDMNQCAAQDYARADSLLNKNYQVYRTRLDSKQQQQLKTVQMAWLKYRELHCAFVASSVSGGSTYSMILNNCLTEKTNLRAKELEAGYTCPEGDLSCPH